MTSKHGETDRNRDMVQSKNKTTPVRLFATILVVVLMLSLVASFTVGGNGRFYIKWYQCKQKPIAAMPGSSIFKKASYYREEPVFSWYRPSTLFCTPLEAEQYGYSADPSGYDFPRIKEKYGEVCRHENDPKSETAYEFSLCE